MLRIEHLVEAGIHADDLEETEAFYCEVLGLEVCTKEPGRHVALLA
jgi:catechol-2,3-dioxygenase